MSRMYCILLALAMTGCTTLWPGNRSPEPPTATETQGFVYDFRDIRIPHEMEIQMDKSSITPISGQNYGVLKFKGRVEPISLFDYFANSMPKDGWSLIAYQKYQRFLMVFTKEQRVAVLTIEEDPFYSTWLEVWVSPRQNGIGAAPTGFAPSPGFSAPASTPGGYPKPIEVERTLTQ